MFFHRTVGNGQLAARHFAAAGGAPLHLQPGAHSVGRRKHIGVPLGIYDGASAAHRQPHNGPLSLGTAAMVFLFYLGQELLKEEIFERPPFHIKIAALVVVYVGIAAVGHNYHRRDAFAGSHQQVRNALHLSELHPIFIAAPEAVKQINYRIMVCLFIAVREIHVVFLRHPEPVAGDAVGHHPAFGRCP